MGQGSQYVSLGSGTSLSKTVLSNLELQKPLIGRLSLMVEHPRKVTWGHLELHILLKAWVALEKIKHVWYLSKSSQATTGGLELRTDLEQATKGLVL